VGLRSNFNLYSDDRGFIRYGASFSTGGNRKGGDTCEPIGKCERPTREEATGRERDDDDEKKRKLLF
jgi:hypothetical protein